MKRLAETEQFQRLSALCRFAQTSRCDGRLDRAHLIPAQRLRHLGLPTQDERVWIFACRKHHHQFDSYFIRLTRDELPPEVEAYAQEHGIEWSLDRDYGAVSLPPQEPEG